VERTFDSPADLLAFLTKLARHKVIDVVRGRTAAHKNDVKRERSINDPDRPQFERIIDPHQATPSQILMSEEEWRNFLADQPPAYRLIFQMLREGKTQEEVAESLGISTRQIRRVIRAGGLGVAS
jgi:RNA polymerase sigma factor (sigma-70 family)